MKHPIDEIEEAGKVLNDLFVIPVSGAYLLYSPLRGLSALLSRKAVSAFKKAFVGNDVTTENVRELAEQARITEPISPPQLTGPIHPAFLGIIPTRSCNAACIYCGFGSKSEPLSFMDATLAAKAVDWMAKHAIESRREELEVHFFGGEPFVAMDVVDTVVHRTRTLASRLGLIPHLEVSTNGQFSESTAAFVGDYFSAVILSLDGTPEIHNRQRPLPGGKGSFEVAARTAKLIGQSQAKLCLRACISENNVRCMDETVHFFSTEFQPSVINFEVVQESKEPEQLSLAPPDPYEFAINFIKARSVAENLGLEIVYAADSAAGPRRTVCPVGKDVVIVSPNGRLSACYLLERSWKIRGLDLNLGWIRSDGEVAIDPGAVERVRLLLENKPRCSRCYCRWTCAGGCHVDVTYPGCSGNYEAFCIQTRIITATSLMAELGQMERIASLIDSSANLRALALNPSDRLEDWDV